MLKAIFYLSILIFADENLVADIIVLFLGF